VEQILFYLGISHEFLGKGVSVSRLATIREDLPIQVIRKTIKGTSDGIFRLRLMIIEKLLSEPDMSLQEVADALIVNRETVTKCLQLFNKGGVNALKPKKAGRKEGNPKYDDEIFVELLKEVRRGEENEWSVYRMQEYISERFEVKIPESTIYYRLAKMGYARRGEKKERKVREAS